MSTDCWDLPACERQLERVRHELATQTALADIAELAGPLSHECNNFLNLVMLQLAVLEPDVAPSGQEQLEAIRRQGEAFKRLVHQFQSVGCEPQIDALPTDVNATIEAAAAEWTGTPIELRQEPVLPDVACPELELKRLMRFLLAAATAAGAARCHIKTKPIPGAIAIRVRSGDATLGASDDPGLWWAACQRIVRRLHGTLSGTAGDAVVEIPAGDSG